MILQALNDYYQRLAADPEADISPYGFGMQGVQFCLALRPDGTLAGPPEDLRDAKGKAKILRVPGPVKRSVNVLANFAWDNTGYVLGADAKGKPERTAQAHAAFKALAHELLDPLDDAGALALLRFLEAWTPEQAAELPCWKEMEGWNLVFRLDGERRFLHDCPAFQKAWLGHLAANAVEERGMCLVTGEDNAPIPAIHPALKGVAGAQPTGAALVSFNIASFKSFGKEQNYNAPVGQGAAFAYTTALNHLLAKGSPRKVVIGETTVVFWSAATAAEGLFGMSMGGKAEDDSLTRQLQGYLTAVAQGRYPEELGDPATGFFVLGLAGNAARVAVRFWQRDTVGGMAANLAAHYQALRLRRSFDSEPEFPSPWQLLRELASRRDSKNISPLLAGQLLRAIVGKLPYPRTLLTAAVERIRADRGVNSLRAAMLKAWLVRNAQKEVPMSLDIGITDVAYRLGRLFALVERIQENAVPGANATVRDRFFGAASATPARVFPIILRNAQHGLAKIRKEEPGKAINLEKALQEILNGLDAARGGFPAALRLEEQGMFILGYYQQRQAFFTKKETAESATVAPAAQRED